MVDLIGYQLKRRELRKKVWVYDFNQTQGDTARKLDLEQKNVKTSNAT